MKNYYKISVVFALCMLTFCNVKSQNQNVSINDNGNPPNSSAMLDISSTSKGLLIPRVSLLSSSDVVTIPSPATSLLVYNINAGMTGGGVGFWYWNGTQWVMAIGPQGPTGPAGANGVAGAKGLQAQQVITEQRVLLESMVPMVLLELMGRLVLLELTAQMELPVLRELME